MNILLNGFSGFMGSEVVKLASAGYRDARVTVGVDPRPNGNTDIALFTSLDDITDTAGIDCIIDFSHHSCVCALLDFAKENSIPTVVCTTGHTEDELLAMPEAEIEIIEKHHNRKLDAPSGTALMIASALTEVRPEAYTNLGRSGNGKRTREEIGIHAIRMGNIVGEHEVIIGTQNQTITLKHEAHSRALFAEGAIAAAEFLVGMKAGLYDMKSIVSGNAHDSAFSEN